MAISKTDITGGIGGIGGMVGSYYAMQGNQAMASGYGASADIFGKAIGIAKKNVNISEEAMKLSLLQSERSIYKTISGQQADVAGAGFAASGSALDLLADSTAQGELTQSLIRTQGKLQTNSYELQVKSLQGQRELALAQQSAALTAADGAEASMWINGLSAAASFFL